MGFPLESPEYYIRYPRVYLLVSWVLIFGLFAIVSLLTKFPLWIRVALYVAAILLAETRGKTWAIKECRRKLQQMLNENDLDDERKNYILRHLKMSDSQLLEVAKVMRKWGI